MSTYSSALKEALDAYFTEQEWTYTFREERGLFEFRLRGGDNIRLEDYRVRVTSNSYAVTLLWPVRGNPDDETQMKSLAEFFARANYGIKSGHFDLDFRDGEISYTTFVDGENCMPSHGIVSWSITCPDRMFRRYAPGIFQVLFGGLSAKEACELCEKPKPAPPQEAAAASPQEGEAAAAPQGGETAAEDPGDLEAMLARLTALFPTEPSE